MRQLPPELAQLTQLQRLSLEHNSALRSPPPEIVTQGTKHILAFLSQLQQESFKRHEAKLLVVGEGGTGKTSLLRVLHNKEFDPQLPSTHGIEVEHLKLSHPHLPRTEITLNTLDFGGQEIYHATHQFFLTQRSLYLVVWSARHGVEAGNLNYWLHTINALAPDAPILLVATHIDERNPDLYFPLYKEAYPQIIGQVGVSNSERKGFTELKAVIANIASQLPLMGQPWPKKWLLAEEELLERAEHHIDAEEYANCCLKCGVEVAIAKGTLGSYLHDLGKILYFRDDYVLSNLVVLKPNWVTKAIDRVLTNEATSQAKGILLHSLLPSIWKRGATEPCRRFYGYEDLVHRMEVGRYTIECLDTFVDVWVPTLLYGIHTSTDEVVITDIKEGQQRLERRLDDLQKLDIILEKLNQQSELIVRNFTRQWNLEMKKMEAECPNVFLLKLGSGNLFNPKNWVSQAYQMYLVCQHPPGPHPTEKGYTVREGAQWWIKLSPWLDHLMKFLKFGVPLGKAIGAVYDATEIDQIRTQIELMQAISDILPSVSRSDEMSSVVTLLNLNDEQQAIGPALRALHSFLTKADPNQFWGGLQKTMTPDGNILWLCDTHRKQYEARPLILNA